MSQNAIIMVNSKGLMAYTAQKLKSQLSVIVLLNIQEEAYDLQKTKQLKSQN